MNASQCTVQSALLLTQLLERLEASRQPFDAGQYRLVVERLSSLLAQPGIDWQPLLARSAAAAALYENLHYAEAGLCRRDLDAAMRAEMAARDAIEAARRQPFDHAAPGAPTDRGPP
ncbi:MAG: hypothetical protein FWG56_00915 [Desulfovibrionaceae bacterium]|nr:hypothetical protein [Desulfovibrionaceae bacterium]